MTAISIKNLYKDYNNSAVLRDINIDISGQEFCVIVGASGCGKSTFLRMLLSEITPTGGKIQIDGLPIATEPGPDRGVVYQRYSVFPHMTVLENVMLGPSLARSAFLGRLFGKARRLIHEEAMRYLQAVGLEHACNLYPASLSGGMQQRLAIAQALIMKPKVLLLDEPFGALDPGTRKDMHDLILRLWKENQMMIFMVTHDLQEGFLLGTRVLVFDKIASLNTERDKPGATITYDIPLTHRRKQ